MDIGIMWREVVRTEGKKKIVMNECDEAVILFKL